MSESLVRASVHGRHDCENCRVVAQESCHVASCWVQRLWELGSKSERNCTYADPPSMSFQAWKRPNRKPVKDWQAPAHSTVALGNQKAGKFIEVDAVGHKLAISEARQGGQSGRPRCAKLCILTCTSSGSKVSNMPPGRGESLSGVLCSPFGLPPTKFA